MSRFRGQITTAFALALCLGGQAIPQPPDVLGPSAANQTPEVPRQLPPFEPGLGQPPAAPEQVPAGQGNPARDTQDLSAQGRVGQGLGPEIRSPQVVSHFAILGESFGVARLELTQPVAITPDQLLALEVTDQEGRIFYPTVRDILVDPLQVTNRPEPAGEPRIGGGRLLRRLGDLVRQATADTQTPYVAAREVMFLFQGDQPLKVRTSLPDAAGRTEFVVTPTQQAIPYDHATAMNRWWSSYSASMNKQIAAADYPTVVESYLVALLAGRFNLPLPGQFALDATDSNPTLVSTLKLIAGTESIRAAVFRRAAIGASEPVLPASLPLPASPRWSPVVPNLPVELPAVEPLATRVPPECFYIRYGSFANYLWFRDLSEEYGGDIGRMIAVRGSDNAASARVEAQLNLKTTAMSRLLGATVIEDQAIIGRDLFLSEGASLGVLFRAKNAFLLQTTLQSDRNSLVKADPNVKLITENILGREVTFLHTVDNRVRSFMVTEGDTIFVTNSRTLMRRFLEVSENGDSLAKTPEFVLARQLMPLDREDTVFAYFSPEMLRGLVSPQSLIETRRRLYSMAEMSLLSLARRASAAEGQPLTLPEDLIDAGYLPRQFGLRSDGSGLIVGDEDVIDSLRGRVGTMLPVADVSVERVTQEEQQWYGQIASFYESQWQQIDPIVVGIKRTQSPDDPAIQRLSIHAEVAPFVPEKYGNLARQLGPPTKVRIRFAPDDIVAIQAHVVSDQLNGSIPPHHLFAAIKDTVPPAPEDFDGLLKSYQAIRALPGYIGAWPQPGLLDRLPLGIGRGQPVGPGLSRLIGGVYRYQGGGFSILSFQSDLLMASLPFLAADEAADEAQVRLTVGDLRDSQIASWVNTQIYQQNYMTSRAGADFLTLLSQQLKVPSQEALTVAESLLGGKLQDPLGGSYRLVSLDDPQIAPRWESDAWPTSPTRFVLPSSFARNGEVPAGYSAPMLKWFRGGTAQLTQYADRLVADAVLDVQRGGPGVMPQVKSPESRPQ